jgi:c-di-AMP phosphodiesterase-like protein
MNTNDVIEKIAIPLLSALVGAVIAFIYQKRLQTRQDKKYILATLMAYRHVGPSNEEFVKAINMVAVVFHDNKKVKEWLDKYFEYTSSHIYSGGHRVAAIFDLILAMAKDVGYNLTHADVKEFFVPVLPPEVRQSDQAS